MHSPGISDPLSNGTWFISCLGHDYLDISDFYK